MSVEHPIRPVSRGKLLLVGVITALGAAWLVVHGLSARASNADRLQTRVAAMALPTVTWISPSPSVEAAPTLELPGKIEAHARAPIFARVSGYLKRWHVDIGARVKAGQLLAEIETPELDQQLMQAQAELASVKANAALSATTARRWQSLQAQNFVSAQAVEEKLGDLAVKQAQVNASQANVDRLLAQKAFSRLVAPFAGVVTFRGTDIGALVSVGGAPGSELFVISDVSRLRVSVTVPQNQIPIIRQGDKVRFTVPEMPGVVHTGVVKLLSQAIGTGSGGMLVQLMAENNPSGLLPGGFAKVIFDLPKRNGLLTLPPSALIFGKAGPQVATLVDQDKVLLKPVKIGRDFGSTVELASGLSPEDRVIDSPPDGLVDGDQVKARKAEPKAAKAEGAKGESARGDAPKADASKGGSPKAEAAKGAASK